MIFAVALLCVLAIAVSLGVGISDLGSEPGQELFKEGYLAAYWADLVGGFGFHLITLASGVLLGLAVAAFSKRK